jgi:hypothetical protein
MRGFLKGFCSLFDWMTPRTLDERLQDLYDDMNWGEYKNPNVENVEMLHKMQKEKTKEFLDNIEKHAPKGSFIPYAYYNKSLNTIEAFFKDHASYTQPLNENLDLIISQETGEVVGLKILNINEVVGIKKKTSKKKKKTLKKTSKKKPKK